MERIQWVYVDGQPLPGAIVLAPGQTHQFAAEVVVVDTQTGEEVAVPSIDTSVTWQIRFWSPKQGYRDREKPWNAGGEDPRGPGSVGTITSGGLYTAPSVFDPFYKHVLVYAVANGADQYEPQEHFIQAAGRTIHYMNFGNRMVRFG